MGVRRGVRLRAARFEREVSAADVAAADAAAGPEEAREWPVVRLKLRRLAPPERASVPTHEHALRPRR